jgi:pyruvate dehydrogenase E2 component (dihydrolipoamide acetyltransferase)
MIEFRLPSLGADMEEGKLLEWKVRPGDAVTRGQVVAIVDTSKAAIDVEIWSDGTVHELLVQPGQTVPVGTPLALLLAPGESAAAARAGRHPEAPPLSAVVPAVSSPPADRKLDTRRVIAAAMSRSKRDIPHYYLSESVPLERATRWLATANERRPVTERLLMSALQLKAVAAALLSFPDMNGFYRDGAFHPAQEIHLGVAVWSRQGVLIAPAIQEADRKSVDELMRAFSDLVRRARAGGLRSSEMASATITVTNLGDRGVESVFGVIHPPQVALVGFGRVSDRPWVIDRQVRAVPAVTLTLSADHRVSDGHRGARFLSLVGELLQQPERL